MRLPALLVVVALAGIAGCAGPLAPPPEPAPAQSLPPLEVTPQAAQRIIFSVQGIDATTASADWPRLRADWRAAMAAACAAAGVAFVGTDGEVPLTRGSGVAVLVKVNRLAYAAGKAATLDAEVDFVDVSDGRGIGRRRYTLAPPTPSLAALSVAIVGEIVPTH